MPAGAGSNLNYIRVHHCCADDFPPKSSAKSVFCEQADFLPFPRRRSRSCINP